MDIHIKEFYQQPSDDFPSGNFHQVIALNEARDIPWDVISRQVPKLKKGGDELAHLTAQDRIEFTRFLVGNSTVLSSSSGVCG